MANNDIDQDALAAAWGAELDGDEEGGQTAAVASEWASMIDEPESDQAAKGGGMDRILNQEEIDHLLGYTADQAQMREQGGIRAIVESAMVSYERLPMLEIIFDRLVRLMTSSLRGFTSDNVEVSLENITSIRFGDYLQSIPLPAILTVVKAVELENFALVTVESNLIYSMIDVLLGGRRGTRATRVEGRPYTTIEMNLVGRMLELVLADARQAFQPVSSVNFEIERIETNPRFATISRPANACILVQLRIDMEDRGGRLEMLLPYATIEPIRELLMQAFTGERFGRDPIWEGHLATEVAATRVDVEAVLASRKMPLRNVLEMSVGDTLMLDVTPADLVTLRCGDVVLTEGRMGRMSDRIAVRVAKPLRRPNFTLAAFEDTERQSTEGARAP